MNYYQNKKISQNFPNDEKDVILSTGEQISCTLIAGKLIKLGFKSGMVGMAITHCY